MGLMQISCKDISSGVGTKRRFKLAARTLSVANSLKYLCHDSKIMKLENVSPTAKCIKIFNNLFNTNSKNLLSENFKAPHTQANETLFQFYFK